MVVTLLALGRTLPDWGGAFPMWSSVTADLAERLVPDGGKGLLGEAKYCRRVKEGVTREKARTFGRLAPIATQGAAGLLSQPQRTLELLRAPKACVHDSQLTQDRLN